MHTSPVYELTECWWNCLEGKITDNYHYGTIYVFTSTVRERKIIFSRILVSSLVQIEGQR